MKTASTVFAVLSAAGGFAAAWLWFKASTMPLPFPPHGETIKAADIEAEYFALVRTATFNRWAAIATGAAALFGALSVVASRLS
jgi:hypothetical protein